MSDNKEYKVADLNIRTRATEDTQAVVDENLKAALLDLTNRALDPTVQGMALTAVFKGADDTIDIADLSLQRNGDVSGPSLVSYTLGEWKHRVPESVNEVYETLSGNLGFYYNDMTEADDHCETLSLSIGDPTDEILITTRKDSLERSFFEEADSDNDDESEGCDDAC